MGGCIYYRKAKDTVLNQKTGIQIIPGIERQRRFPEGDDAELKNQEKMKQVKRKRKITPGIGDCTRKKEREREFFKKTNI